jgi:hypothetical protein
MTMDVIQVAELIIGEMKPVFGKYWNDIQPFANHEAQKLAEAAANIVVQRLAGTINDQQASLLLEMQKDAAAAAFAAVRGIGEEAACRAVLAGLSALKEPVNEELGFELL